MLCYSDLLGICLASLIICLSLRAHVIDGYIQALHHRILDYLNRAFEMLGRSWKSECLLIEETYLLCSINKHSEIVKSSSSRSVVVGAANSSPLVIVNRVMSRGSQFPALLLVDLYFRVAVSSVNLEIHRELCNVICESYLNVIIFTCRTFDIRSKTSLNH
ncbi:hypothetical protein KC19_VG329500 [Ceratodon purpureus]|uniref:Secreted protein n=1 Tax=Ceratodon purpureus TaxID=3225 RepID=A0A8T0HVX7_CERPU|nr:hypothetical protein KC19_VG329500 [Ceratodon purpureus]